ncbi:MAG: hypothetical protein ABFD96_17950 [Armatimonadia bacterium]
MVAEGVFATGLVSSYCTSEDVFKVLRGYDLTGFGGEEGLAPRVRELLPITMSMVESCAGRDFRLHAEETVRIDGTGTDRVYVIAAGVPTPATVKGMKVDGQEVSAEGWRAYPATGMVRLTPEARLRTFTAGVQNVELVVDWGWETTPAEVALVQAKLTAAELLAELGGEGGTVAETRIGDYAVRYAEGGKFGGAVQRLCAEADAVLRRYVAVRMAAV